ncbi:MAG: phosphoribosylglycinamide formyltransferase [Gammaproteobacteria bacterium]|nr:phosphoribosylglycinamide formyltransferase [Gammaproteobacteria bacterium]NNM13972.1 phosphoribosylglycinamide formyltransferase [Gammaproteobacteria bacterium]
MFEIVVLISGNGSNLQAIIDAQQSSDSPARIKAVISNKPKAFGLQRAKEHAIPAYCIPGRKQQSREEYDQRLMTILDKLKPDLIVLAGFMRIFTPQLVERFANRIINIHPSLLPKYKGLHTHQRALDAGDREHGCSVHLVTAELDDGPVIAQAKTEINSGDNSESLSAKVQKLEHTLYPEVIDWFARGRLSCKDQQVCLDGTPLEQAYLMNQA